MAEQQSTETEKQKRRLNINLDAATMFATPRDRKDRKQLRLTFGCSNGYPNVNVETDEDAEPNKNNGWLRVSSRLNAFNFYAFLDLIEEAASQPADWKDAIECWHTWKDGVQHETAQHINDLVVGVDKQDLIYISIVQAGRKTSKFVFGPTEWHNYKDGNGNPLTQKDMNRRLAKAAVASLRATMGSAMAIDHMDNQVTRAGLPTPSLKPGDGNFQKQWTPNGGGQGGGGGYNNGGGFQKKPWQQNGGGGGQGNFQKKPWQQNGGGQGGGGGYNNGGGFQKKPWQQNGGGQGGGGNFQQKTWQQNGNNQGGGQSKWSGGNQGGGGQAPAAPAKVEESKFDDLDY